MIRAFESRDPSYDGIFITGVKTTGIFCRPTCSAKKPLVQNVEFFVSPRDALFAGFRPCKRCRPMEASDRPPVWLTPLLEKIEIDPSERWRDRDLRELGLPPDRVRRWFKKHHKMTFHAYSRARRLGAALGQIQLGNGVASAAFDAGYESLSGFSDAVRRIHGTTPSSLRKSRTLWTTRIPTPLGPMIACATNETLCLLEFADRRMLETQLKRTQKILGAVLVPGENDILFGISKELEAYFEGRLTAFLTPLELKGTPFQEDVWRQLLKIPFGTTTSYASIAESIGNPKAVRAVARANGDNRMAIIIPCHRVIGKDGTLTGYGGGLWRKRRLLDLETGQLVLGEELESSVA
ncbi:MAG: bifunctional transcriptional activator/DNA repair protein Ada [Bacteroidetes bacterium]|nr:MAG: bifunctional transcriptional activator/DNA repair protein Ada [Bacteroidota bacterium]